MSNLVLISEIIAIAMLDYVACCGIVRGFESLYTKIKGLVNPKRIKN
jgi:hypothetical protein